ncbi:hypothetical protein LTS08_003904 [Lithohypha guttulata]|nr:hypothetical protein LTS08_003904 [Lithohypha guttulata]
MISQARDKKLPAVSIDEIHPVDRFRTHQGSADPVALRLPFLISLNILLVGLCVSIAVLWHFSNSLHGFEIGKINHYVLTYGPTAILVWIVAAWRQIDFHTKSAAPWCALSKGSTLARKSVLLDYVSTFQAAAFWKSFRNRHISVVLSILGFVLLKIATLSSTGLLVLEPAPFQQVMNLTLASAIGQERDLSNITLTTNDPSLVYTTYGTLAQNLPKPFGLGNRLAYPTFSLAQDMSPDANLTLQLEAFVPSYQCQKASITAALPPSNSTDSSLTTLIQLSSPACTFRAQNVAVATRNPRMYRCPDRQLSGFIRQISCDPSAFGKSDGAYHFIVIADMRYSQQLNATEADAILSERVNPSTWSTDVAALSGVVCRLSYSLQPIQASAKVADVSGTFSHQPPTGKGNSKLNSFNDTNLDRLFTNALIDSDGIFGSRDNGNYALEYPDPMLKLMGIVAGGGYEPLLNATIMSEVAEIVATQLAAQIGHQYLRKDDSTLLPAVLHSYALRLRVTTVSAWVMCAMLAIVVLLNSSMMAGTIRSPSLRANYCPVDATALLRTSMSFLPALLTSQGCTEAQLHSALRNVRVDLIEDGSSSVELTIQKPADLPSKSACSQPWWHPITVSKPVLALTLTLTVVVIAVLEVLQRVSDSAGGFTHIVDQPREFELLYIHFLPALVVLLVATMFNCLDFNVLLLSPFHRMRKGCTFEEVHQRPLVSQAPPLALWNSLRRGCYAAFASSSAALVGSLMTVVVSGLYNIDTISVAILGNVQSKDSIFPVWNGSATNDNGAALITSLTENLGFSDPRGTYTELVFPYMHLVDVVGMVDASDSVGFERDLSGESSTKIPENSTFSGFVPSWRADLECTILPETNFSSTISRSRVVTTIRVNATYGLPAGCHFGGENGTESVLEFVQIFPVSITVNSTYFAKLLDLHVGPYDPVLGASEGEREPSAMRDNPLGCPSLALVYGFTDLDGTANAIVRERLAVEVCYQKMQRLNTSINFLNSEFELDPSVPPLPDESTVEYAKLTDATLSYVKNADDSTSFQFRVQEHFDTAFVVFNGTNKNPFGGVESPPVVDKFFQGSLFGRTPLPLETLKLASDVDREKPLTNLQPLPKRTEQLSIP